MQKTISLKMNVDINKLVDKIYVLTIDRNSERHPNVKSVFKGIDFEFWNGLDGRESFPGKKYVSEIDPQFFTSNDIDKNHVSRLTIGQLGAYFSIKKMINHVAESQYDKVLIFEDDMKPQYKDWKNILQNALAQLPADWDILLVGYNFDGFLYKNSYNRGKRVMVKIINYVKAVLKRKYITPLPVKFSRNLDISGYSMGGHAYCLSKKGAILISSYLSPMRDSGDVLINQLIVDKKIKAYSVYPCLFLQDAKFESKTKII